MSEVNTKPRARKYKRPNIKLWLLKNLLAGAKINHDDAINAGFDHRLSAHVFMLREFYKWRHLIKTSDSEHYYYIPPSKINEAKRLAMHQGFI